MSKGSETGRPGWREAIVAKFMTLNWREGVNTEGIKSCMGVLLMLCTKLQETVLVSNINRGYRLGWKEYGLSYDVIITPVEGDSNEFVLVHELDWIPAKDNVCTVPETIRVYSPERAAKILNEVFEKKVPPSLC